nr:MAG TPA: hypothetical protein [Bacteriophage sp.]
MTSFFIRMKISTSFESSMEIHSSLLHQMDFR